jgi:riboflavin synthase
MFTGIVEELGTIEKVERGKVRIRATTVLAGVGRGDSIAVNGCCLTVVDFGDGWWDADVSPETIVRTSLASQASGSRVNLERAVRADARLGGHIVQGHVDGVGDVVEPVPDLRVRIPSHLVKYVVEKGSIAVDGVSLTVVDALDDGFTAAIIPHTADVTTLGNRRPGDRVNIEVDVMAKYTERLVAAYLTTTGDTAPESAPGATA